MYPFFLFKKQLYYYDTDWWSITWVFVVCSCILALCPRGPKLKNVELNVTYIDF